MCNSVLWYPIEISQWHENCLGSSQFVIDSVKPSNNSVDRQHHKQLWALELLFVYSSVCTLLWLERLCETSTSDNPMMTDFVKLYRIPARYILPFCCTDVNKIQKINVIIL